MVNLENCQLLRQAVNLKMNFEMLAELLRYSSETGGAECHIARECLVTLKVTVCCFIQQVICAMQLSAHQLTIALTASSVLSPADLYN